MKITEIIENDNNLSSFPHLLGAENIVPNIWYHKLLRKSGKSDSTAISILSELVFLHRYNGNTEFQLNFKYFKNKFNFGLSQVKDAVVRLEKLGLVSRSLRTVVILDRPFANEMFLVLNINNVLKLNEEHGVKKIQSSSRNDNTPSGELSSASTDKVEKFQFTTRNITIPCVEISSYYEEKTAKTEHSSRNDATLSVEISPASGNKIAKLQSFSRNQAIPSAEISSDRYIDIDLSKNNKKSRYSRSRSSESSFLKIFKEEKGILVTNPLQTKEESGFDTEPLEQSNVKTSDEKANRPCQEGIIERRVESAIGTGVELKAKTELGAKAETEHLAQNQSTSCLAPKVQPNGVTGGITEVWSKFSFFGKKLSEFYPLSNEDRDLLVVKSGRDFDLNFINQLLLKISDKYPNHKFYNKNSLLNYVAKLLEYELRDAVKVSNGCFRFKSKDNDIQTDNQEHYLQGIESSLDTCKIMQLKRKIAGIFEANVAYRLLLNTEFSLHGNEFIINTRSLTSLAPHQQDILLAQVQSVYGNSILSVNIQAQTQALQLQSQIQSQLADRLSTDSSSNANNEANSHSSSNQSNYSNQPSHISNNIPTTTPTTEETNSIWSKVRHSLIQHFRDGQSLDKAWFSKLEAIYDHANKKLTLKAPNNCIRDRVWQHYGYIIEKYCVGEDYQLTGVQSCAS